MPSLLLQSGPQEVAIYGDGSFSCDLLVGAWAAHVPSFGLQIAGSGSGPSEGHFEFCALVAEYGPRLTLTIRLGCYTCTRILNTSSQSFASFPREPTFRRGGVSRVSVHYMFRPHS